MWCIPTVDEAFTARMLDVLEVYERPYDPAKPQVCVDEKNHQLLDEQRAPLPMQPGKERREDGEYVRKGSVKEFVAVEPKVGTIAIQVVAKRTAAAFAYFIAYLLTDVYPEATTLVLVTDNLNIHTRKAFYHTFPADIADQLLARIDWHYTPKHASWLDQAEIAVNGLTKAILRKRLPTQQVVEQEVAAYQARVNRSPKPIKWQFTRQKARDTFHLST